MSAPTPAHKAMRAAVRRYRVASLALLMDVAGVGKDASRRFIAKWEAAGHLKRLDVRPAAWVLVKDPGPAIRGDTQQRIWNAARTLKIFTKRELTACIHQPPPQHTLTTYIKHLTRAGHLISDRRRPARYCVSHAGLSSPTAPTIPRQARGHDG